VKIGFAREGLADQGRADDPAIALDEAAIRLFREERLRGARHRKRIGHSG
jgi:hypothetical protein